MGSYLFIRGISVFAGGFPAEWHIITEVKVGGDVLSLFDARFYAYMAAIVVLSVLAWLFQFHMMYRNKNKDEEDKKEKSS